LNNAAHITSDRNRKTEIGDSDLGLDFIYQLRSRKYKMIDGTSDRVHYGFIAQEIKYVLDTNNISTQNFAGYIAGTYVEEGSGLTKEGYALRYEEFISPMVKSIQEMKDMIDAQQQQINSLQATVNSLLGN
jgi:hypothetical protein